MKLLEIDRVKAVWNKYAANKIIVTMIKSENIKLKWNLFDDLENLQGCLEIKHLRGTKILLKRTWGKTWKIQRFCFGGSLQGIWFEFAKGKASCKIKPCLLQARRIA